MLRQSCNNEIKTNNKGITTTVLSVVVMLILCAASCTGNKENLGDAITERDSMAVLITRGGVSLISDSGKTKYRIVAEEWAVFDRKNPKYWAFEKGAYLEQFDSLYQVNTTVKSDTAYYYDEQGLWKLIGNVHIENVLGEKFDTHLLYWDSKSEKIYTDEFIRIEQIDRIVWGNGLTSNQQMTVYNIRDISGEFFFDDESTTPAPPVSDPPHGPDSMEVMLPSLNDSVP